MSACTSRTAFTRFAAFCLGAAMICRTWELPARDQFGALPLADPDTVGKAPAWLQATFLRAAHGAPSPALHLPPAFVGGTDGVRENPKWIASDNGFERILLGSRTELPYFLKMSATLANPAS